MVPVKRFLVVTVLLFASLARARDERSMESAPDFSVSAEPPVVPQGGIITVKVHALDAPVKEGSAQFGRVSARGFQTRDGDVVILLPVRIEERVGAGAIRLRVVDGWGRRQDVQLPIRVKPGEFDTDELGVRKSFTDPSKQQRAWAREDARAFESIWAHSIPARKWRGTFVRPMPTPVTARFGTFRTINGKTRSRHMGLDLRGKRGDEIRAVNDGIVVMARNCFFSGNTVVVDHGNDVHTLYFHMTEFRVKQGDRVKKGQVLGTVGDTGRVTGPHLHFGAKLSRTYVDPEALFALRVDEN